MKDVYNTPPFEYIEKTFSSYWIDHYSNCAINRINNITHHNYSSWQDELVKKILGTNQENQKKQIIEEYLKNTTIHEIEKHKLSLLNIT